MLERVLKGVLLTFLIYKKIIIITFVESYYFPLNSSSYSARTSLNLIQEFSKTKALLTITHFFNHQSISIYNVPVLLLHSKLHTTIRLIFSTTIKSYTPCASIPIVHNYNLSVGISCIFTTTAPPPLYYCGCTREKTTAWKRDQLHTWSQSGAYISDLLYTLPSFGKISSSLIPRRLYITNGGNHLSFLMKMKENISS